MKKKYDHNLWFMIGSMLCLILAFLIIFFEIQEDKSYENAKNNLLNGSEQMQAGISPIEPADNKPKNASVSSNESDMQKQQITFPIANTLKENNIIGWVYIDGIVNEPIMQAEDNAYYLTHSYDGSKSRYGSAFLDCDCKLNDPFLLIYGHNVKGGRIFGSLKLLRDEKKSRTAEAKICFAPAYEYKKYKVCMVSVVQETNDIFALSDIPAQLKANALFIINEIDVEQQTVLLSTCYGNAGTDKRIIIALQEDK